MMPFHTRIHRFCAILPGLGLLLATGPVLAQPGTGLASISPTADVTAGAPGTWTILYEAGSNFTNGMLRVTIPPGWTAPQDTDSTLAGYVTVTSNHGPANPALAIAGRVISVTIADLPSPKTVSLGYGDDSGGASPAARASAQTTVQGGVVFLVESDPTGALPQAIAASPTLSVVAGGVTQLVFTSSPFSFPSTGEAGPMVVEARDTLGNTAPVPSDAEIDLSSSSITGTFSPLGGAGFSPVTSITMTAGASTDTLFYRDTRTGTPAVTAAARSRPWSPAVQAQTVTPGPPVDIVISPQDTTLTAGDFMRFRLEVMDANGNRAPLSQGRSFLLSSAPSGEFFSPSDHGTPVGVLNVSDGQDSTLLDYRNTDAAGGAPHLVIVLSNDGLSPSLFVTTDVTVTHGPVSAAASRLTAESPVVADGTTPSTVTVTVNDTFANPVPGATVRLGATPGAVVTDPAGPTGADGRAAGTVSSALAQSVTVTATADLQALSDSAVVSFIAGPVSAAASTVDATGPAVADDAATSTITITAKDAQGNRVGGVPVVLSVAPSGTGETLVQPGGVTDAAGQVQGLLRSATTGPRVVTATADGVSVADSAVVDFVAGAAAGFAWAHDGNAIAGVFEDVTLEVLDAPSNRVVGFADTVFVSTTTAGIETWAVGPGAQGALDSLVSGQWFYVFDLLDSGLVQLRVRVTRKETVTLSAQRAGAAGASAGLVVDHGPADRVQRVAGDGQTAEVATAVATAPVVRVVDAFGNRVDGEPVTFGNVTGGGVVDVVAGGVVDTVAVTGADGLATCALWQLGGPAGPNTVLASMAAGSTPSVPFAATGIAGTGVAIDLLPLPAARNVTVGTDAVVRAVMRDSLGNTVPGARVDVLIKDAAADGLLKPNPSDPNPTTTVNATARFGVTDTTGAITLIYQAPASAGVVDTLDAFGDGAAQADVADATYTSVASGATDLRLVFITGSVVPAGQSFSFRIEAVDGNGNIDTADTSDVDIGAGPGGGITFSETDFGAQVTRVSLAAGVAVAYGRGQNTGTWGLDVSDVDSALTAAADTVDILDSGVVDHYIVSTLDSVEAGAVFQVTVSARDTFGNVVAGANNGFALVAVAAGDSTLATADTLLVKDAVLGNGGASIAETYLRASDIRIRARDGVGNEGFSGAFGVTPAPAYRLVEVSGDSTNVVAGGAVPLEARVRDRFGNALAGEAVAFAVNAGGGAVVPPGLVSDAAGRVATTLTTGTTGGNNQVMATIGDGNPPGLEKIEFTVQTVADTIDHYEITPAKTALSPGEAVPVQVRAFDSNDNLVGWDSTTTVRLSSDTGNALFADSVGTLVGGFFSTTVSDTVAETLALTVQTTGGGAAGTSVPVTVVADRPYEVTKISGDATGVPVGAARDLQVEVRDTFGNVVGGVVVIFDAVSEPGGAFLRDAVGDSTDGIVTTDGAGRASVRLHTAQAVGLHRVRASILDGTPAAREARTFDVATAAAAIASYVVTPDTTVRTAGAALGFTVRAFDDFGNAVTDSTTLVDLALDPGSGGVFAATPQMLQGGVFSTTVSDTIAEVIRIRATSQGDTATGLSAPVTIHPAAGSGVITATASPDTITAGGTSPSTVASGPVRDRYGNLVSPGTAIRFLVDKGTIATPDRDPSTPATNEQVTDTLGTVSIDVVPDGAAGTAMVSIASVAGSAVGTAGIVYAPPPAFVCGQLPDPSIIVPGDSVAFKVPVQNTSTTGLVLSPATLFEFNDGIRFFSAALAAPKWIAPSAMDTLVFELAEIDSQMTPTTYQPVVRFGGTDQYGASFGQTCQLPAASVRISTIDISSITANPIVTRGRTENVAVGISNLGPDSVVVTDVTLNIPVGDYTITPSPDLPDTIPGGMTSFVNVAVTIQPSSALGTSTIDASVAGVVGVIPVSDNSIAPATIPQWTVQSAASLSYVAGSFAERIVSQGQAHGFTVTVQNQGQATVTLDSALTTMSFGDSAGTYTAKLAQPTALAENSTHSLQFTTVAVPASLTPGPYDVALDLRGTENGGAFAATLRTGAAGDSVRVVTPANPVYQAGTLTPAVVNTSTETFFEITVANAGSATIELSTDSTRFSFAGGLYDAALDPVFGTTVSGGGVTTLRFATQLVDTLIGSVSYAPVVRLFGVENGLPFDATLTPDSVRVQEAPNIAIVALSPSWPTITTDQGAGFQISMTVANAGQAVARFDSAHVRLILGGSDRTFQFLVTEPSAFDGGATLGGGQTDFLRFDLADAPAVAMDAGVFTLEGELWLTDVVGGGTISTNTNFGGKGSLVVQTPARLVVHTIDPAKTPVTEGRPASFEIRMTIGNDGESGARVLFDRDSTGVSFSGGGGWLWSARTALAGGDSVLAGGEMDTVVFDVSQVGTVPGSIRIDGFVRGVEENSGRIDLAGTAAAGFGFIEVQTAGTIEVLAVTPSRPTVTELSAADWEIRVRLRNNGESDVALDLPAGVNVLFQDEIIPAVLQIPTQLLSGSTVLAGLRTDSLVVVVDTTGAVSVPGVKDILVLVSGTEINSGTPISSGAGSGSVGMELFPQLAYVAGSLVPGIASAGTEVEFRMNVSNTNLAAATLRLDPAQTRFRFGGGLFAAGLDPASIDSVAGGAAPVLRFRATLVDTLVPLGAQTAFVDLVGVENGNPLSRTLMLTPGDLLVQQAPQLSIKRIAPKQATVTSGQGRNWDVIMAVRNNGQASVDLDLASTALQFVSLASGNVTGDYVVQPPVALETGGGTLLPGGIEDSLRFVVLSTGDTTGTVLLNGTVVGVSPQNPLLIFSDDTVDGGSGSVTVQPPGVLDIVSIAPSQPTLTAAQLQPWVARMVLRNTGGATVQLQPAAAALEFAPAGAWFWTPRPALEGGGTRLDPGEIDSLFFDVTATAVPGSYTMGGRVSAVELNSGDMRADTTDTSGTGNVEVETAADLSILQITKSREPVTNLQNAPWTIDVTIRNNGTADLALEPAETRVTFPTATPADTVTLPSGAAVLEGDSSAVLRFTVGPAPDFGTPGSHPFDVHLAGRELNTDTLVTADSAAVIAVQLPPDPAYVPGSLNPVNLTRGSNVVFAVDLAEAAGTSNLQLDPDQTRFVLSDGTREVRARLDATFEDSITAGASTRLVFENTLVDSSFLAGTFLPEVQIAGIENGNGYLKTMIFTSPDSVTIVDPARVRIDSILVSQGTVTASQTRDWTVRMVVVNGGDTPIRIDSTGTGLNLTLFGAGDVTGDYTITGDYRFENIGSDVLPAAQTGEILFTVGVTGPATGQLSVHGQFAAVDTMTAEAVTDNTFDGGWANVVVQAPASLRVMRIRTSQAAVTAGQGTDWWAVVQVQNTGEAAARLVFDAVFPEIRTLPASGFQWLRPTRLAGGADSTLAGGELDSLIFTADATGSLPGPALLHAAVRGIEGNSGIQNEWDTELQGSGFGTIVVQDSARVDIESTVVTAPNSPNVNTGQVFGVRVGIANPGEADLADVTFTIAASGGSVPQPPDTVTINRLAGGATMADTLLVMADGVTGAESVTAVVVSAFDANAMDSTLVIIGPHTDSLETFAKTTPALLAVSGVAPSQPTVTRQQTKAWTVDVTVRNDGGTELTLATPAGSDLSFFLGPAPLNDYIVAPPSTFLSGRPGWTVGGFARDTLRYFITTTGSDTGSVRVEAALSGSDVNDLTAVAGLDSATVRVVSPSGLRITATRVDTATAPNNPQPDLAVVNSRQPFVMEVVVRNSGEAVDSVEVTLSSDGATMISAASPQSVSMPADSSTIFAFAVTADSLAVQQGQKQLLLTSAVTRAVSVNSGLPVAPKPPVDDREVIVVQKPVDLGTRLDIAAPPQALDGSVSTGQTFAVTAVVENRGTALEDGSGELTLSVPAGFLLGPATPDSVSAFVAGTPVSWDVVAPAAPALAQPLTARISRIPLDINTNAPGGVSLADSTVTVDVLGAAGFSSPAVSILSPGGATDATLSAAQEFVVEATVVAQVTTVNITSTLVHTAGLQPVGPIVRSLADGNGGLQSVQYRIRAPAAAGAETLQVRFDGTDANTGTAAVDSSQSVPLQVVPGTALTLSAVLASPEAQDGSVSVGAPFTVKAVVENAAVAAAVDTSVAKPRISMTLPAGYALDATSPPASQAFTVGAADDSVTWIVRAPMQISGPDLIVIRLDSMPADENSGLPAVRVVDRKDLAVQTEASVVTVQNISSVLGLSTRVVPKGARDVQMMAVRIENPDVNADSVRLRWIDIAVRDQNGGLIANPAAALDEFYAVKDGLRIDGVTSQNPVRVPVDALGQNAVVPPQGSTDIVFGMSIAAGAVFEALTIEVRGQNDMRVENVISSEMILVVDKVTRQDFAGTLRSRNLVILSSQFSEYTHNYPNPFRAGRESTRIAYFLNTPASVSIRIFTIGGELVYERRLAVGEPLTGAGPQEVLWDGRNMAGRVVRNGLYVCRVEAGPNSATFRIAVAK